MNLWLRFFWLVMTLPLRPKLNPMDIMKIKVRIYPNDLDTNLHVNNGRYFTIADLGRMDYLFRSGLGKMVIKEKYMPILADATGKFRKELKVFEKIILETEVKGWDDKFIYIEHRFVRENRIAATVVVRSLFKGPKGKLTPKDVLHKLGLDQPSPDLPEWIRDWSLSCEAQSALIREQDQAQDQNQD